MGKTTGFMEFKRKVGSYKPTQQRVANYDDIYIPLSDQEIQSTQAARCMDCGVPFCSYNCPLGNIIPDFNDLVYHNQWHKALDILHTTNNFPEFTGKICPALCEGGCVLGIIDQPVTIEQIELAIAEKGWHEGWIKPKPPAIKTPHKVAVIGSGPAGLATAQQLIRVGHQVTVYERADALGGCLRYGIPDYKLPKHYIDRRIQQMEAEGVIFKINHNIGINIKAQHLIEQFDAICLTGGSTEPRDLTLSGRELIGIHFATDYLKQSNQTVAGTSIIGPHIHAHGKKVVVIGGGDTGADCVGTALRQGAIDVCQLELLPMAPLERDASQPWPVFPRLHKITSSHEEARTILNKDIQEFCVGTKSFSGKDGQIQQINCVKLTWEKDANGQMKMHEIDGTEFSIEADLILFAMGFVHPEHTGLLDALQVQYDTRGNVGTDSYFKTNVDKVFSAGDMRKGQSLVVHAIAEGRKLASAVDLYLMGETSLNR